MYSAIQDYQCKTDPDKSFILMTRITIMNRAIKLAFVSLLIAYERLYTYSRPPYLQLNSFERSRRGNKRNIHIQA